MCVGQFYNFDTLDCTIVRDCCPAVSTTATTATTPLSTTKYTTVLCHYRLDRVYNWHYLTCLHDGYYHCWNEGYHDDFGQHGISQHNGFHELHFRRHDNIRQLDHDVLRRTV